MVSVLALDIGGTKVLAHAERWRGCGAPAVTAERRLRWSDDAPAPSRDTGGPAAESERLLRLVGQVLDDVGATRPDMTAVAFPGSLDAGGTVSRWPMRPSWCGTDLRALLARRVGRLVIGDDGLYATHAEAAARPDAARDGLLYLGLGTGVGGAVTATTPTAALSAPHRFAVAGGLPPVWPMEPGHLVVAAGPGAQRCGCGRTGCLQAYASGTALAAASARVGTRTARAIAVEALALALANLAEVHRFARAVLGGGAASGWPALPRRVQRALARRLRPGTVSPVIEAAVHRERSSLVGALTVARAHLTLVAADGELLHPQPGRTYR